MKKTFTTLLILTSTLLLAPSFANAKCNGGNTEIKCQSGKCQTGKKEMKNETNTTKPAPKKGKCGQGKCGS